MTQSFQTGDATADASATLESSFTKKLKSHLSRTRDRLVDRNLRNKLISTNLKSSRTKNVRFFNSTTETIFSTLLLEKKELAFVAYGDPEVTDGADTDADTDADAQISIEVEVSDQALNANELATKLSKEGLKKKLRALYYEAREVEEEQGVNVLYLAVGFLKWYESDASETERFAPLVLLPVELLRSGAQDVFKLKLREDDLFTNISLKLWLREQNSIDLPDIPDDDAWSLGAYFAKVQEAIKGESRWQVVQGECVLGLFSFNKFMLWRDLDPDNWPSGHGLLDHPVIQQLLIPPTDLGEAEPPLIPATASIDDHFTPQDLCYVVDADSSQTEAIQTVLAGKNLVIQGPPGTGKSQTITNIIAAAVKQGKRVLFVAEKMAALNVVHDRLSAAGLKVVALELHSRRATKSGVLQQLRESVDSQAYPAVAERAFRALVESQDFLNVHAKRVNLPREPWGFSAFEMVGEISKLQRSELNLFNFAVPKASSYTKEQLSVLTTSLKNLSDRLVISGVPSEHPWRDAKAKVLTPMDVDRLALTFSTLEAQLKGLAGVFDELTSKLTEEASIFTSMTLSDLRRLSLIAKVMAKAPKVATEVLADTRLQAQRAELLKIALKLSELKSSLQVLSNQLIADWSELDLVSLRTRFAGTGGSLFSIFNKNYRLAMAELKGMSKAELPKGFKNRLALLDNALLAKTLKADIQNVKVDIQGALGELWQSEDSDSELLSSISTWYETVGDVDKTQLALVGKLFEDTDSRELVVTFEATLDQIEANLGLVISGTEFDAKRYDTYTFEALKLEISFLLSNMQRLNEWPNVYGALNDLQAEIGQDCYDAIYEGRLPAAHIVPAVRVSVLEKIWKELVTADESLSRLDAFTLDRNLNIFKTEDRNRLEIAKAEVLHSYSNGRPTGSVGQMGVIRQELEKKTRLFPVRKLMNRAGEAVHLLKPVFLMSPMSIAQFLEPGSVTFDLLLIDEASQIRPEDALGAIARAKQVVVVGDSKQLPPTNFFSRLSDDEAIPGESEEDDNHFLEDVESVLGLCSGIFKSNLMLRWHYRSRHPGLIAVSNRHFYENKLMMPPSVLLAQSSKNLGVSFVASPPNSYQRGGSDGGRNVAEAELIAQEVIAFAKANPTKSLGVAAFSVKQRDAIRDLIDDYRAKNSKLEPFFSLSRKEPFFVKNLESIQGDERDVIFISVGYGRSSDGRLTQTFGPLGADGGERRLNVLISRAKERCTVFSSITAEDVRAVPGKLGVNAFREFLQFAKNGYFDVPVDSGREFASDFEESIATFLLANGYEVKPQVGMVGFFIDIGVVDPNAPDRFLCGIECDGATYHSSRSARDRDRLRQDILEARGWNIYRIWSTDWFHRRQEQEQRVLDYLVGLQNGEDAVPEAVPTGRTVDTVPRDEALLSGIYENPVTPVGEGVVDSSVAGVNSLGPVQPYKEYQPEHTYSCEPHEQPFGVLKALVMQIVTCEGPIHSDEVAKRVATCHRLDRAGARVKRVTEAALRGSIDLKNDGMFWRLASGGALVVRDRSQVASPGLKSAVCLPPAEIDLAMRLIIKGGVRVEETELMQHTAKMFGFLRCGPDLKQVIKVVLESNLSGKIRSEGSVYSLL